ncbi:hypothetical protein EVAR_66849_1 [Eumeta japonica]|uniref:Uncharacterized protein n=1 Tax=Eumeta variegata TaxID=151549 RepID=A0A4C1Z6T8_EUMVA|nr:hypothetical protein EVAR_66849_1 [Eumeta japonica]
MTPPSSMNRGRAGRVNTKARERSDSVANHILPITTAISIAMRSDRFGFNNTQRSGPSHLRRRDAAAPDPIVDDRIGIYEKKKKIWPLISPSRLFIKIVKIFLEAPPPAPAMAESGS